ncbi:MAG: hypothetical protein EB082_14280 [Verrucomicrobia bacterium]|nr:hypothetical protein [Verrucomicrobiota bacterium]NBU11565.1 hypothetical protein [Pseudomonadota bacterium]NDD39547.1 hypothetical protein [Verrucomicrobiota bacterium]
MNDAEKLKLEQELKEAAPLINRLSDGPSVLPDHIKARLNSALDKKFPLAVPQAAEEPAPARNKAVEREKTEPSWLEVWRWWIGLATATAAVALVVVLNRPGPNLPPVIQVAMLDSVGTVRGTGEKPMDVLQRQWKEAKPVEFDDPAKLKKWEGDWSAASKQTVVKVVYNRDTGELRISLRVKGGSTIEKVILAKDERELPKLILEAVAFIRSKSQ